MRRSAFELGIEGLEAKDCHIGSRILYYANGCEKFAEHELDYIVFAKKDVEMRGNSDEVMATQYVSLNDFEEFIRDKEITPWFKLLVERSLMKWWENIETGWPDEADTIIKF